MTNDERAQIRATGATSAHVGMNEAEQERARVVAWLRDMAMSLIRDQERAVLAAAGAIERGDHLKGVE